MNKATISISDELYKRVKAKAALDGISIKDITSKLYESWLENDEKDYDPYWNYETWNRNRERLATEIAKRTDTRLAEDLLKAVYMPT